MAIEARDESRGRSICIDKFSVCCPCGQVTYPDIFGPDAGLEDEGGGDQRTPEPAIRDLRATIELLTLARAKVTDLGRFFSADDDGAGQKAANFNALLGLLCNADR